MPDAMNTIFGREAFLALLESEGVSHLFGNPGTTELPVMAALPDRPAIRYVMALQEALVVAMADGYSRASGDLGVCNVHVAPGLGNAMGSLYNAKWMGSPIIVTAGQQEQGHGLTEPMLYDPLVPIAQPLVKWAVEVSRLQDLPRIVHTGRVASLHEVREADDRVEIGAAATYAEAEAALGAIDPDVGEMLRRLGSKQVRATGTIGGNIANGSPIGDSPPVLIALGATIELRHRDTRRALALEDFFLDYGRQDRAPGEILTRITVPRLGTDEHFRCYKISKRFDQDISALLGAFRLRVEGGRIVEARIAYGGMAATPKRARCAERAAVGLRLDQPAAWPAAAAALTEDFSPIDDHRASAAYRMRVARSLLAKALAEAAGRPSTETRVAGIRGRAAA